MVLGSRRCQLGRHHGLCGSHGSCLWDVLLSADDSIGGDDCKICLLQPKVRDPGSHGALPKVRTEGCECRVSVFAVLAGPRHKAETKDVRSTQELTDGILEKRRASDAGQKVSDRI